jgi:hypothetical protein
MMLRNFACAALFAAAVWAQSPGVTQSVLVTGAVQIAADGSGTLTLYSTITTEDGEATAVAAMVAEITPAAGAPAKAPAPRASVSPRSAC